MPPGIRIIVSSLCDYRYGMIDLKDGFGHFQAIDVRQLYVHQNQINIRFFLKNTETIPSIFRMKNLDVFVL